jgi:hypothetical protein
LEEKMADPEKMRQLRQLVSEIPELKDSFIDEIFEKMEEGEFFEPEDYPTSSSGEKIVGTVDKLEKTCLTLSHGYAEKCNKLNKYIKEAASVRDHDKIKEIYAEFKQTAIGRESYMDLFWMNLNRRFNDQIDKDWMLELRSGSKVAVVPTRILIFSTEEEAYRFFSEDKDNGRGGPRVH